MTRDIAICAKALSLQDAPWGDPGWEFWCIGNVAQIGMAKACDLAFEIHADIDEHASPEYKAWLAAHGNVMTAARYPLGEMLTRFPRRYLTSSVALALALAIGQGPARIGLWGVNCDDQDEYIEQRPCIEYMLGRAEGAGIEVVIPDSSPLLKATFVYGLETSPARTAVAQRIRALQGKLNLAELAERQAGGERIALQSAITELTHWKSRL